MFDHRVVDLFSICYILYIRLESPPNSTQHPCTYHSSSIGRSQIFYTDSEIHMYHPVFMLWCGLELGMITSSSNGAFSLSNI